VKVVVLVAVNTGSTSVKLAAFETHERELRLLARERAANANDVHALLGGFLDQHAGSGLRAIVHRVVHGGSRLTRPTRVDAAVEDEIKVLSELAPLHNPMASRWIGAARALCGARLVQIAVFDTAFFATLPRVAAEYAVPPSLTAQGVRRYGFHGIAHQAMWRRWSELRPDLPQGGRLITAQLGGGSSMAALASGRPIDTSMGFSPLEGLVMRTRSGDVDPAVVPFLAQRRGCSSARVVEILNREAGLAGVSGTSGDVAELTASPSPEAMFALELYCYRARKYLGAFLAALEGCDGIAFGGGVGEHAPQIRSRILQGMAWAGMELDRDANEATRGAEARISTSRSTVAVHVIPVDEEQALARAALEVL
jgi:acetate kinase